jgi:hypothetical protein
MHLTEGRPAGLVMLQDSIDNISLTLSLHTVPGLVVQGLVFGTAVRVRLEPNLGAGPSGKEKQND